MRILWLGGHADLLRGARGNVDDQLLTEPVSVQSPEVLDAEFIVSFGYRHIVPPDVLAAVGHRAVNLHISLLPWNRGADPNLWSWLEGTPKGVSVHWMTTGVDQGDLVAQRRVALSADETLRSSYDLLTSEIQGLFISLWPELSAGRLPRQPQPDGGTYHRSSDRLAHPGAAPKGWDTRCADVEAYGRKHGLRLVKD